MMLVLGRREQQSIVITNEKTGEEFEVMVTQIEPKMVKLGFTAPDHITIKRKEIAGKSGKDWTREKNYNR